MKFSFKKVTSVALSFAITLSSLTSVFNAAPVSAATNIAPSAKISFTFDDGLASAYTQAAPTLAKYGLTGTNYVTPGCVGMTTAPNTCHANTDNKYMSWDQVLALKSTYGWEIGSHSETHPYLATSDAADGQPAVLTQAQVIAELTQSKADLAAHGIEATDFSTPYGDYNNSTLAQIAKVYASHRGFADVNANGWPYNDYLINDFQVQGPVTVAQVKAKIDEAITNKTWLVLTFHELMATGASSNNDDYQYATSKLDQIAAYVKTKVTAKLITSTNINNGLVTGSNMFVNGSFNDGISDGWTTSAPSTITADSGNNGSYPDPTNAVKLTSSNKNTYLFSPRVAVETAKSYMFKNFVNVTTLTSGELAFYVDEYDAAGNWISGQYKTAERSAFVENINFMYTPSSALVKSSNLQVIVTANSGITAYLDNSQMFPLDGSNNPTPTVPPVVTPTNLMTNGEFDSGISGGWSTNDAANIKADSANHGATTGATNSISLSNPSANNHHLFSPQLSVTTAKTYSIDAYLNLVSLTAGEVAFYIDEYDAAGNWISGQYKTGVRATSTGDVTMSYTPSSQNVAKSSLQVIVTGNSNIQAYIDNIRWYLTN